MAAGDDARIKREKRHFIVQGPEDPTNSESVKEWLQLIANEITENETFNVAVEVEPSDADGTDAPIPEPEPEPGPEPEPEPGEPLPEPPPPPAGGPIPASYRFDFNPCPGKGHYAGGGA